MSTQRFDAVVVGAGFAGLYMLHLLRGEGLSVQGVERAAGVGGTWYWNRYPGCRCDVESIDYSYQFSQALEQDWVWTERYAAQPEILAYAEHVAKRFDLLPLIRFETSVTRAHYDEHAHRWTVETDRGDVFDTRFLIMGTGCLSAANTPDFPGSRNFTGRTFHTGLWPQNGVDFTGRRVGIIGTGSSAIQSIPIIATEAADLTVFQRTANFSVPARNRPVDPATVARVKANYADYRQRARQQPAAFGPDNPRNADSVLTATPEERKRRFEEYWQLGGFMFLGAFGDLAFSEEANAYAAEFVRSKIRETVKDSATAELLSPKGIIGCKRLCADTGYYETFNRANVHLVDVSGQPIERFTAKGLVTGGQEYAFDDVVFATGFDAMTGSLLRIDIRGRGGVSLNQKWAAGPLTYLGLMVAGFPNLFTMTGPGSPSVLANMVTGVEQHAEYIRDVIGWLRDADAAAVEAEPHAEDEWVQAVNARSQMTLFPRCNSWYLGANVPGKPRVFMPYIGFPDYSAKLESVRAANFAGFALQR
jgi:cation diffusion facilitator CzcD-associated flavoprotein CzcO